MTYALLVVAVVVGGTVIGWRPLLRVAARRLLARLAPRIPFDPAAAPPAPDYRDPTAWAVLPAAPAKAALTPPGIAAVEPTRAPVDAFFVHPTTFFGTASWNAPLDDPRANEGVDEMVVPGQTSVFNGSCRIFAPRYRQATLFAFMAPSADSRRALELAYADVRRAFEHYLEHDAEGRPFILASHSQGTVHALRLMEEMIAPSELRERLVAAYLIGYWVPEEKLATSLAPLATSHDPADTGCILAWDTYGEGGGPDRHRDRAEHWYPTPDGHGEWRRRATIRAVCVNPLTGRCETGRAPAELNLGSVHAVIRGMPRTTGAFLRSTPLGVRAVALSAPHPGEVSARCGEHGFLFISRPSTRAFRRFVMPGASYHNHDYGLFYMNLRADIERRVQAYLTRRA